MCLFSFTVLSCECIFLCVLCCLMITDMFHIQMQFMQRLDQCNEYIYMYVRTYVIGKGKAVPLQAWTGREGS